MYDYDAIVIGAGLGGLSSAALLQNKGLRTLVCENTNQVGGCCSSVDIDGYRFDIGASIVEMSFVIDELFKSMGKKTSDYIDFMPIDPIYGFVTEDGDKFTYPVDPAATREIIAGFSPRDAKNWDRFQKVGSEAINKAFGQVMTKPMYSFKDMLGVLKDNPLMAKYLPYMIKNFEMVLTSFFEDEKVRSSMSLQSYFLGLPPALCPGYVTFLAYAEHEGIFYPRGGMIGIPRGIANAFEEMGGEIKFNTRVKRVLTEGKRVIGVELADGIKITSKIVVSDINAKTLYLDMIGRGKPARLGLDRHAHLPRLHSRPHDHAGPGCRAGPARTSYLLLHQLEGDEPHLVRGLRQRQDPLGRLHAYLLAVACRSVHGAGGAPLSQHGHLRPLQPGRGKLGHY